MYTQAASSVAEPIVVNLTPPEIKVEAGGQPVEIIAEVRNAGQTADQYSIEIENLDPSWYTITGKSVALFPGDSAPIPIKIHPPRSKDTRAGSHAFLVKARSQADPMLVGKTKGVVIVGSYAVFNMELAPARATGYRGKYRLKLANGGNSELQLALETSDPESNLAYGLKKTEPTIQSGSTMVVPFTVKPKGLHLVGEGNRYKFTITGTPTDGSPEDAKQVQGELVHKPPFATWRFPIILLLVLGLVGLFLILKPSLSSSEFCSPVAREGVGPYLRGNLSFVYGLFCTNKVAAAPRPATPGHTFDETKFHSGPGYIEVRDKNGDAIGQAEEDEWYDDNGVSHQKTANGQLMYFLKQDPKNNVGDPQIYFVRNDGKTFTFVECNPPRQFGNCKMVELNHQ